MPTVTLLYFASLRERAGVANETLITTAANLAGVYDEIQARHGLTWPRQHLRVAMNGEFASWDDAPVADSEIAFIPPVSGG